MLPRYGLSRLLIVCALLMLGSDAAALATPPATPEIREPGSDGQILNPADVHMETSGFDDVDGDTHKCSDWQIWSISPAELAWQAPCAEGALKSHIHLGDGTFVNTHAGRSELKFDTEYELRVRFRDSASEVGAWADRPFLTSAAGPEGTPGPVPWKVERPGFEVEVFAAGFQLPVNVAMVPNPGAQPGDPLLYVAELYGKIKVVTRDGTVSDYATGLLDFDPTGDFPGSGEMGLTGLAVDPISGDVFASLLYAPGATANPLYAKVIRLHTHNGGLTSSGQETVLDMAGEEQAPSHQISNLTIGPDGNLYVHNGDNFQPGGAQDLDQFRGKVLRMTLDGDPLPDNPFYDGSPIGPRDYVYAYGFRNPFGGAWRAADGSHYEVENGPSVDRLARVDAGVNYCWLITPSAPPCDWTARDEVMRHRAIYNWEPSHAPVNIAFVQRSTANGSGFPDAMQDHAFVTESGPTYASGPQPFGKRIVEFAPDESGELVGVPSTFVEYTGTGKATASGLAAGPDGLYFTDLYEDTGAGSPIDPGANVLRVHYVDESPPPGEDPGPPGEAPGGQPAGPGPGPAPTPGPGPIARPGIGTAAAVAQVRHGRALLRIRCGGPGGCRGIVRLIAKTRFGGRGLAAIRNLTIGRSRFFIPPGRAGTIRIALTGRGTRLLHGAGRRGLRVTLTGSGVRTRPLRLVESRHP